MLLQRNYRMDDAHLIITAKTTIAFMRRDIAVLAGYGITNTVLESFTLRISHNKRTGDRTKKCEIRRPERYAARPAGSRAKQIRQHNA